MKELNNNQCITEVFFRSSFLDISATEASSLEFSLKTHVPIAAGLDTAGIFTHVHFAVELHVGCVPSNISLLAGDERELIEHLPEDV